MNRFDRCKQILCWLEDKWPTGRSVKLVFKDKLTDHDTGKKDPQLQGQCYREGGNAVIELKIVRCSQCLKTTLWHEYAHLYLWGLALHEHKREDHPAHFYTFVGEIEQSWMDLGHEESKEYEV